MEEFRFTVLQRFSVEDENAEQAKEMLFTLIEGAKYDMEASGVNAYRPVITVTADADDDELAAILGDAMVGDEYEDGDGYSRSGQRRVVDDTDIPERLIAWRDAAIRQALEAAVQRFYDNPMWASADSFDNAQAAADWFAGLLRNNA